MTYVLNMIHICPNIYILYPIVIFKIIYVIAMYKKLGITNIMKIARKNYFNISKLNVLVELCPICLITQTNINIVRTYVFHMLGSYVSILFNWLIL